MLGRSHLVSQTLKVAHRAIASRSPHIAEHLETITRLVASGRYMRSAVSLKDYLDVLPRTSAGPSNEIRAFAKHWKPHDDAAVHRRQSQFCTFQLERSACGENDVTAERRA
jgi:hypothetical protein